jgi:hypothetical protein
MRIATGRVVHGWVVLEGEALPEGAEVAVLAREPDETFTLDAEQEEELLSAIEQVERGETVTGAQLLERLRRPS